MTENSLRVMSFNLRNAHPTPTNEWHKRLPVVQTVITEQAPDVIGTQEGLYPQLQDMERGLPGYRWIGLGREGGSRSEFMAVWYRPERLEPIAYDHFWLSDTPEVIGSSTWGNDNRRMVTWVRFRDLKTTQEFYFWNTHLDFTADIHARSIALIRQRMQTLSPSLPLILVGDFNAGAGIDPAYDMLVHSETDSLIDTWATARECRSAEVATFHGYETPGAPGARIDWILTRGPWTSLRAEIIQTVSAEGQYPSDHFPIVADVMLEE